MTRFFARLLVRLLSHPEVQAELRKAVTAAQAERDAANAAIVDVEAAKTAHNIQAIRNYFLDATSDS